MNFSILQDLTILQNFIDWLPELGPDECFMLLLFARKKYAPNAGLKADKGQLKRVTCTKKNMVQKIRQMEVASYAYELEGKPVPHESLALYITVNPRSQRKAASKLLIQLATVVANNSGGYNVQALALSELQKAAGHKTFFDIDIDGQTLERIVPLLEGKINPAAVSVLSTRGGIHLLVEFAKIDKQYSTSWYRNLTTLPGVDIRCDNLIPVPGCCQGGFVPSLAILH